MGAPTSISETGCSYMDGYGRTVTTPVQWGYSAASAGPNWLATHGAHVAIGLLSTREVGGMLNAHVVPMVTATIPPTDVWSDGNQPDFS